MADEKTTNLGLTLTTDDSTLFKTWRETVNGKGDDESSFSNAQIIDNWAGEVNDKLADIVNGAKTTGGTLIEIVDNKLKLGNIAALDKISKSELNDELADLMNRKMNGTQFELEDGTYSLKYVYCGTSTEIN
jgi:hypothetical protein